MQILESTHSDRANGHYTSFKEPRVIQSATSHSSSSSRSKLGNELEKKPSDDNILSLNGSDDDNAKSTIIASSDGLDMSASSETPSNRIRRIEERVGLLTRSTVLDEVNNLKPPGIVSLQEDMKLTDDELLAELRQTRQELLNTYSAYTRAAAALNG